MVLCAPLAPRTPSSRSARRCGVPSPRASERPQTELQGYGVQLAIKKPWVQGARPICQDLGGIGGDGHSGEDAVVVSCLRCSHPHHRPPLHPAQARMADGRRAGGFHFSILVGRRPDLAEPLKELETVTAAGDTSSLSVGERTSAGDVAAAW